VEKEYRKTVPFGINKKSVDLFLNNHHRLQENELQGLRDKVERARSKDELLNAELKELRERQRQSRTKDLLEHKILKPEEALMKTPSINDSGKPNLKLITLPSKENETIVHDKHQTSSGFWGDANYYLDEENIDFESNQTSHLKNDNEPFQEIAVGKDSMDNPQPYEDTEYPEEQENTEIEKIKRNYIVGKLAGADIIDSQGRIILTKHFLITDNMIRRVQREGKLVELIVNMVMPERGD
jgi:hypothetical protein